ncbi:fluoride efflux transporter CrcB [Metabacillus bambusae]|uniref:Fluoride-specific ion channel FluC n=1 Tax=Metabacillus bambusae TaxID=2795218 RepID=A0ABS3N9M0_9BACI|nr:fluoride efflux transporter CrcB [Metabacillus bambusae]MBO1514613.1 fluoride efflux transporter CrcB [Metabacillus bambusae]
MVSVLLGGAVGAVARYLLGELLLTITKNVKLPLSIVSINIIGALLLGFCVTTVSNEQLLLFFATGFCGGFTTFSTFSVEAVQLIQKKQYLMFLLYILLTISGGILGVFIGKLLAT